MRWWDWAGVVVAVAVAAVEAVCTLLGRLVVDGPVVDARPRPQPGERVAYAGDPVLFGPMVVLRYEGERVVCELDPPVMLPEEYTPKLEAFGAGEIVHADEVWKGVPVTQAGLPRVHRLS